MSQRFNGTPRIVRPNESAELQEALVRQEAAQKQVLQLLRLQRAIARLEEAAGYVTCPACKGQVPVTMQQTPRGMHVQFGCETCQGFGTVKPVAKPTAEAVPSDAKDATEG